MNKLKLTVVIVSFFCSISFYGKADPTYNFKLIDSKGSIVKLSDFKGKVVVLDFWFTGCINCMNFYQTSLSNAERHFIHSKQVVFVSICIDKQKTRWLSSLAKGQYASATSVNLYTEGLGDQHQIIKQFQIITYPQPIIISKNGEILYRSEVLTKRGTLIESITKAIAQ